MRRARAVILSRLRYAVALLRVAVVRSKRRRRQHDRREDRESFRPFAPSILREDLADWFEMDVDSPYMLLVADVIEGRRKLMTEEQQKLFGIEKLNVPRSDVPAVTHVDYSARIQTVRRLRAQTSRELRIARPQSTADPQPVAAALKEVELDQASVNGVQLPWP